MDPITIGIIIGAVVGVVGGGIGWGVDRHNRTQRYEREQNECRQTLEERRENIRNLKAQARERKAQNRANREIIERYENNAEALRAGRDRYRAMNEDLRNRRDDMTHDMEYQSARNGFNG